MYYFLYVQVRYVVFDFFLILRYLEIVEVSVFWVFQTSKEITVYNKFVDEIILSVINTLHLNQFHSQSVYVHKTLRALPYLGSNQFPFSTNTTG